MPVERRSPTREISTKSDGMPVTDSEVAYWRGRVDMCLEEVKKDLESVGDKLTDVDRGVSKITTEMQLFTSSVKQWQSVTDGRITTNEKLLKAHDEILSSLKKNNNGNDKTKQQFGTWDWFRDDIIMPAVKWLILTTLAAFLLLIANQIIEILS